MRVRVGPGEIYEILGREYEGQQLRLLDEPCSICGRRDVLLVAYRDTFACVDCITKENGEDDASPGDG